MNWNVSWKSYLLLGVLACLATIPLFPVLFDDNSILIARDLNRNHFPFRAYWQRSILNFFEIPMWNYYSMGGGPAWANIEHSSLFPLNFVYLFFSTKQASLATSFFIAAHLVFFYCGCFFLLRTFRVKFADALLFSLCFVWSGTIVSTIDIVNVMGAFICLPYFLAFFLRYQRNANSLDMFGMSFFLAWPIYAGDPHSSYMLVLFVLAVYLYQRKFIELALLGLLSFLAAAPQLLPSAEYIFNSNRPFNVEQMFQALSWSFHPSRISEFFFHLPWGNYVPEHSYRAPFVKHDNGMQPYIFSMYLGVLACFSLFFYFSVWGKRVLKNKHVVVLVSIAFFLLILSFGKFFFIPIYKTLHEYFPGWSAFRYPQRLNLWTNFLLILAAALAWRKIKLYLRIHRLAYYKNAFFSLLLYLLLFVVFYLLIMITVPSSAIHSLGLYLLLSLLFCIFLWRKLPTSYISYLLIFIVLADQGLHFRSLIWEQPRSLLDDQKLVKWIQSAQKMREGEVSEGASRKFTSAALDPLSEKLTGAPDYLDPVGKVTWSNLSRIGPNSSILFQIEEVMAYGSLHSKEKLQFWSSFQGQFNKLFALMGVYYLPVFEEEGKRIKMVRNQALPYLFIPQKIISVNDFDSALTILKKQDFSWRDTAVIEGELVAVSPDGQKPIMKIIQRTPSKFIVRLNPSKAINLVWNESYDRHWHATIDGKELRIHRANAWSMAVQLDKRDSVSEIIFYYQNPLIRIGLVLGFCWLLIFVFCFKRRKKLLSNPI